MAYQAFEKWRRDFPARFEPFNRDAMNPIGVHRRFLELDPSRAQQDSRSVEAILSTTEPCVRAGFKEVLSHDEGAVDLSRCVDGTLPLLRDHDPTKLIGSIRNIRNVAGRLRGTLVLSSNPAGEEALRDILDGHLKGISVGYSVAEYRESDDPMEYAFPTVTVTRWMPFEASATALPLDIGAKVVGRAFTRALEQGMLRELPKDVDMAALHEEHRVHSQWEQIECIREHPDFQKAFGEYYRLIQARKFKDAFDLGAAIYNEAANAKEPSENGYLRKYRSSIDLHNEALVYTAPNKPEEGRFMSFFNSTAPLGSNDRPEDFSLCRAALMLLGDPEIMKRGGPELAVMMDQAQQRGKRGSYLVPHSTMFRDVAKDNTGANLIGVDHRPGDFVESLKATLVTGNMGATILPGLTGDIQIPRQITDSVAGWIEGDGNDSISASDPTFDKITMSPSTVGTYTTMSRKALLQGEPATEALLRRTLAYAVAKAIDSAALSGSGNSNVPLGIIGTSGINALEYANAGLPDFDDLVDMEGALLADDSPMANLGYVSTPVLATALKKTPIVSGQDRMVWSSSGPGQGIVNGYRAMSSSIMPAGNILFGNWRELIIALWSGLDMQVDTISDSLKGSVRILVFQDVDVAVRHAQSFCLLSEADPA